MKGIFSFAVFLLHSNAAFCSSNTNTNNCSNVYGYDWVNFFDVAFTEDDTKTAENQQAIPSLVTEQHTNEFRPAVQVISADTSATAATDAAAVISVPPKDENSGLALKKQVYEMLLGKFNKAIAPEKAHCLHLKKVRIFGWPSSVKTFQVRGFTRSMCETILEHMDDIRFERNPEFIPGRARMYGKSRQINFQFYAELLQQLSDLGICVTKRNRKIDWSCLHRNVPEMFLRTHDYRSWTEADRDTLQRLVLEKFVPEQQAKLERRSS